MPLGKADLTMRIDNTGKGIIGIRGEYVCNIARMLFNIIPGSDPNNMEKGLNIQSRRYKTYNENMRDSEYEGEITHQFTTYTDLIPINVVAIYKDKAFFVLMSVKVENQIYDVKFDVTSDKLDAMIRN